VAKIRLTVRHGARVSREVFDDVGEAMDALERRAKDIRSEGPLQGRKLVREFAPADLRIWSPAGSRSPPAASCAAARRPGST
jgi:hypothetical protein